MQEHTKKPALSHNKAGNYPGHFFWRFCFIFTVLFLNEGCTSERKKTGHVACLFLNRQVFIFEEYEYFFILYAICALSAIYSKKDYATRLAKHQPARLLSWMISALTEEEKKKEKETLLQDVPLC